MPRDAEASLNESQFFLKALQEKVRLDGRGLEEYRPLQLSFGEEYGSVDIRLGKTRILTRISASVTSPNPDRPFDGLFTITTELSTMASPTFATNLPTQTETLLSRLLEKTIRRSQALDTESLCLIAGQKVWSVRADVHVVSHDGNLVDAACIGVLSALAHFRKEDVSIEGETVIVWTKEERELVPLSILHMPLCVTFSFYGGGAVEDDETILLDTTSLEEGLREGYCTFGLNRHGEICQIAKLGGMAVDAVTLLQCLNLAAAKVKSFSALITQSLAEDAKRRDRGGVSVELSAENAR